MQIKNYLKSTQAYAGDENVVMYGGALKAMGVKDGKGILAGHSVVYGDASQRDLSGQWFTAKTYLGPRDGDGADGLFHHSLEIPGLEEFQDHLFAPIKTRRDDVGLWTEVVLDMADQYEAAVYKLGKAGKLGFSSGSASHMVRCTEAGEITRWPIVEVSLTPTPCEPRARAQSIKSFSEAAMQAEVKAVADELKRLLSDQDLLDIADDLVDTAFAEKPSDDLQAEVEYLRRELNYTYERQMQMLEVEWLQQQLIDSQFDVMRQMHQLNRMY
jgi:hypothetical protein